MIQGNEIDLDDFVYEGESCKLSRNALKKFFVKLESKMCTKINYLKSVSKQLSFREAIGHQVEDMARAIDMGDASQYQPVRIR